MITVTDKKRKWYLFVSFLSTFTSLLLCSKVIFKEPCLISICKPPIFSTFVTEKFQKLIISGNITKHVFLTSNTRNSHWKYEHTQITKVSSFKQFSNYDKPAPYCAQRPCIWCSDIHEHSCIYIIHTKYKFITDFF